MSDLQTSPATVLLVEDREDEVAVALRALGRSPLETTVRVARDGQEALAYLEQVLEADESSDRPQLILLDLGLPRVPGIEVLRRLRADPRATGIPIVVVSSTTRESEVQECYRLGANSFVPKRYGAGRPGDYLVQTVHYWLQLNRTLS